LKKAKELLKVMPDLRMNDKIIWRKSGAGEKLRILCVLLKGNVISVKGLNLGCNKRRRESECIKKMNEMINDKMK